MKYTNYGKTGKQVSIVGFGGMRFDLEKSFEENAEIVKYAHSKGITYFDTAPGYCEDKSEDIFGVAFKDMNRDTFLVSTKGSPNSYNTAEKAINAVKKSISRMNIDKIDFYHIWCIKEMKEYELAMQPGGQFEGLMKCKEMGLIDQIVLSSHLRGNEVKEILLDGKIDGILLGINILNSGFRWEAVKTAHDLGYAVVAMNPLSGGQIPKHEDKLDFMKKNGMTATETALDFLLSAPQITITLNGFTTKQHIDTACTLADNSVPTTDAQIKEVTEAVGNSLKDACTGCGYCNLCPVDIDVPSYMQAYNESSLFNIDDKEMTSHMNTQYKYGVLVGKKDSHSNCIECGLCEKECTQHLPIIDRLKKFDVWI